MPRISTELSELAGQWQVIETFLLLQSLGGGGQIVAANPLRWALWIAGGDTSFNTGWSLTVSTLASVSATSGIILTPADKLLRLNYRESGALCQQAWFFNAQNASSTTWIQVFQTLSVP